MNNEKIECEKCNSKFLILDREKFECTNCKFLIIVQDKKKNLEKPIIEKNTSEEEIIVEDFETDEDLDLFTEILE
jgi:DNA-directed RNA polymerase subunit RPC12/RpoP